MTWEDFLNYELFELGEFALLTGNLFAGVIILVGTWLLVVMLRKGIMKPRFIIDKIESKRRMSMFLIMKYFIWVICFAVVLEVLGVDITVFLFGSTALLVGLGLGLQNVFKDLISGLFLLFEGTIKLGDIIEVDQIIGKVTEINLRSSQVLTREDVIFIIPNSKFISEKVINWTHNDEYIRFSVFVNVAYGSDVELVYTCLEQAMKENKSIRNKPKSFVRFVDFGESALKFEMVFWSKEMFSIENIKSELRRTVYIKLAENKLEIPFPQRDVHIKGVEQVVTLNPNEKNN
ncbi:MAG: mechanosensitive ion channel [Crocinitomicaceae bacterium]|nr:mechanosensitive ion channel [Crocinitomicaceae bacterium]MDG1777104.1 mechanosensitive ion channel [Crocinitomicaceae bacterium]